MPSRKLAWGLPLFVALLPAWGCDDSVSARDGSPVLDAGLGPDIGLADGAAPGEAPPPGDAAPSPPNDALGGDTSAPLDGAPRDAVPRDGVAEDASPAVDAPPPPPPTGSPYGYVTAKDVGQTIGAGAVAPLPTAAYAGPMKITAPTTIEDKVINGCLDVRSGGVKLRNVVLKCSGLYPVDIRGLSGAVLDDVVVEHSRLECVGNSKLFMIANVTNLKVRHNELVGCEDFFFVGGKVDGMRVENNYMHSSTLTPSSHSDGFQIGEASKTTGTITVIGNMILANTPGGRTGIMFATNQCEATILIENNYLDDWGHYTLRCNATSTCHVRHNIFSSDAAHPTLISKGDIVCNRYEDGSLIATGSNVGCPSFP